MAASFDHHCLVRPLSADDVRAVSAIEQSVYREPWSEDLLRQSLEAPMTHSLGYFTVDHQLLAYAIFQVIFTEGHLLNIAVAKDQQGQGLGRELLEDVLSAMKLRSATSCFLEVRPTNHRARSIYEQRGFVPLMERKAYYPDGESAIVMILDIKSA